MTQRQLFVCFLLSISAACIMALVGRDDASDAMAMLGLVTLIMSYFKE